MSEENAAKILIVDDAAFMRVVLKDILTTSGYSTIYEAGDGAAAVQSYKIHKPDLVTMDINMPGMDGLQALKSILEINPVAKIVMVTSVEQKHIVQKAIKLGAKDYVAKPFDRTNVSVVVGKVLNGTSG